MKKAILVTLAILAAQMPLARACRRGSPPAAANLNLHGALSRRAAPESTSVIRDLLLGRRRAHLT